MSSSRAKSWATFAMVFALGMGTGALGALLVIDLTDIAVVAAAEREAPNHVTSPAGTDDPVVTLCIKLPDPTPPDLRGDSSPSDWQCVPLPISPIDPLPEDNSEPTPLPSGDAIGRT